MACKSVLRPRVRMIAAAALLLTLAACAGIADALCPPGNCPNPPSGRINADH